jgi:hypothetical protein
MIRSEKKLQDLTSLLNKDNTILINEAIAKLRDEQPFEGAIGIVTSFYDRTDDLAAKKAIEGFMNDLKDQSVCQEVINEIRKPWKADTISMLVASCWQSGLDYSGFSTDFAEVFIKADYITAIECLTVIEESAHELSNEKKDELRKIVEESSLSFVNEKKSLTDELFTILNR